MQEARRKVKSRLPYPVFAQRAVPDLLPQRIAYPLDRSRFPERRSVSPAELWQHNACFAVGDFQLKRDGRQRENVPDSGQKTAYGFCLRGCYA